MNLENLILGSIALLGKIPENLGIDRSFFRLEIQRKVFSEFRKGVFNLALISEHLKKDKNISLFLSSIMEGVPHSKPDEIVKLVNEVKKDRKNIETIKLIESGARSGVYDFEKIKRLNKEVEDLEVTEKDSNLISLDEVDPKPIAWLWYNKLPSGKISFIVGDPGAGKSLLALYLAAVISRGDDWPDVKNAPGCEPGSVIILTEEDSLDDTVRVRADEMKANVSKIKILNGMIPAKGRLEFFDIRKHIKILEQAIRETGDVRLIVFDPITAYLGDIEGHKNTQVRAALAPLAALANKHKLTIIGINHLNKDQAKKALYRSMGSVAFTAMARSVWLVQQDEDDPRKQRRFFSPLKANVCKDPTTLAFSINGPIGRPKVIFEPEPVDMTAEELLADEETKDRNSAKEEARSFLLEILKTGKMPTTEIESQATELNIAPATLKRARKTLRIKAYQENGQWWVELP